MRVVPASVLITAILLSGAAATGSGPAAAASPNTASASATVGHYRTLQLGTLGGSESQARAINDRGQIVGDSTTAQGLTRGFLWSHGVMTALGALGGSTARAVDINNRGQIVGFSDTASGLPHAVLWQHDQTTDLGTLGGGISLATAINDRGEVTGDSLTADGAWHAFRWHDGALRDLGAFDAGGINNRGQIAGVAACAGEDLPPVRTCAVRWQAGTLTRLDDRAERATAINDRGDIIGTLATRPLSVRAFIWRQGVLTDLGTLGGTFTSAHALNDRGQVVGGSSPAPGQPEHPFLWYRATMVDLTTRGLAPGAFVAGIDSHGRMVGGLDGRAALFTAG
jgi:probable HAF family extracellular repeat protein